MHLWDIGDHAVPINDAPWRTKLNYYGPWPVKGHVYVVTDVSVVRGKCYLHFENDFPRKRWVSLRFRKVDFNKGLRMLENLLKPELEDA